jgi:hypothetical protein
MDIRALADDSAAGPALAVDKSGNAQIIWRATSAQGGNLIQTRHEFPNGSYGPVLNLAHWNSTGDPYQYVALDAHGNARHVWTTGIDSKSVVMARTVASNGTLGIPQQLSGTTDPFEGASAWHLRLAGGPNGRPVAVWAHSRLDSPAMTVQGAAVGTPADDGGDGGAEGPGAGSSGTSDTGSGTDTGRTGSRRPCPGWRSGRRGWWCGGADE